MFENPFVMMLIKGTGETLYMTLTSTLLAYVLGLPLGVILVTSERGGLAPAPGIHKVLNIIVNILRSVPFLILMLAVIPLTRLIVGTSIGSTAVIPPLVIAAFPFISRLVESSIREVDSGIVEAAKSMGATPFQIITKVLLLESLPSLVSGATIATTTILGYSAMAGAIGGGGLGAIAITYGLHRYKYSVMMVTVVLLVIVVQVIQEIGTRLASKLDKRK